MCKPRQAKLCGKRECDICFSRSLASYPNIEKYWIPHLNTDISPKYIMKGSNTKEWFYCKTCSHICEQGVYNFINSKGCSFCNGKDLCKDKNCKLCLDRSLASYPNIDNYWNYDLNTDTPREVTRGCNFYRHFYCKRCSHKYETVINKFTVSDGCPHCSPGCSARLCKDKDCIPCHKRSLASYPNIEKYWDYNRNPKKIPRDIFIGTTEKASFFCKSCTHSYETEICHFTRQRRCCFCAPGTEARLCDDLNCKQCFERSFASHPKAKYWNQTYNHGKLPREVRKYSSNGKFFFDCPECNKTYSTTLNSIANGAWCPCMRFKTETKVYDYLKNTYPSLDIQKQFQFKGLKNSRYDIAIPSLHLIIEIDGDQHFKQVSNWDNPLSTLYKDLFKMLIARKNNYSIIRLYQPDIWHDTILWREQLSNLLRMHVKPTNYYISSNNIYDTHKRLFSRAIQLYNHLFSKKHPHLSNLLSYIKQDEIILNPADLIEVALSYDIDADDPLLMVYRLFSEVLLIPVTVEYQEENILVTRLTDYKSTYHLLLDHKTYK